MNRDILKQLRDFCLSNGIAIDIWLHNDQGCNVAEVTIKTDVFKNWPKYKGKGPCIKRMFFLDDLDSSNEDLVKHEIDDMLQQLNKAKKRMENE